MDATRTIALAHVTRYPHFFVRHAHRWLAVTMSTSVPPPPSTRSSDDENPYLQHQKKKKKKDMKKDASEDGSRSDPLQGVVRRKVTGAQARRILDLSLIHI